MTTRSFAGGGRTLGRTGLTVAPIGFGGHRVRDDSPVHRRALAEALRRGVNLVDTSGNEGDGASERLIGRILADAIRHGDVSREGVVVVSKAGELRGGALERARLRPWPETIEHAADCWHCIHPRFLLEQIDCSRKRLGLDVIDGFLLQSPEFFLVDVFHRVGKVTADDRKRLNDRMRRAFAALEDAVRAGLIAWYGVSSDAFVADERDPTAVDVASVAGLARDVAGADHRMAVVQMPMNVLELGAAVSSTGAADPLRVAVDAGLAVVVNRPLQAIVRHETAQHLVRLSTSAAMSNRDDAELALRDARRLEGRWAAGLGARLRIGETSGGELFCWAQELSDALPKLDSERWDHVRDQVIAPHLGRVSAGLLQALSGRDRDEFREFWEAYGAAMHRVFLAIESRLKHGREHEAERVSTLLDGHLPSAWHELPLSRKAVATLLSRPEVSCVVVGMRQPAYVHDMIAAATAAAELPAADLRGIAAALARGLDSLPRTS